ncbi:MAG: Tex family protein [Selenomonadaceae bacterium]|nr:Tex family protein [Selenomonadaceae bacterium]
MLTKDIPAAIAKELKVKPDQVEKTVELLDDGNTVPFIARYRKEATGSLEDEQIRHIEERLTYLRNLVKRQEEILAAIEAQGKLTDELRQAIEKAGKLQELEDLYLPYKQKKRTRAQMARERGLEPLANAMLLQAQSKGEPLQEAQKYIDAEKGVETAEDALAGARDIIAETTMEDAQLRQNMRRRIWNLAVLTTELVKDAPAETAQTFQMYADYREPVHQLPSHRILAINRGEKLGCLKVKLDLDLEENIRRIARQVIRRPSIWQGELQTAIEDGYKRLLLPALEREVRTRLTETAEEQAIKVFGANLRQLLLQAPLTGQTVMGLDPGYRNGCKMAVVDPTGRVLDHGVLQITQSKGAKEAAARTVLASIRKNHVTLLSIGNGTASYETEQFASQLIADNHLTDVHYLITNEAGASVYSASKLAREELPEYDVVIRGAVSIARRVQDPLAELVTIDPQAIGVGQYQHDVNQKDLAHALDATIESAVNHVGVELNTASGALLSHIAGVSATIARNIVAYRNENGRFESRRQLLKVPRLGPAAFTQCAGFLRIHAGKYALDDTPVHPESYALAAAILKELGFEEDALRDKDQLALLAAKRKLMDEKKEAALAQKLNAGLPTVHDILDALISPGRDPRADLPAPLTRQAIVKLSDLKEGTIMRGTIRNITDFGAFVDIGLHQDGLIHISELSQRRVHHPLDVVAVGDIVNVMVISIDEKRNRIGLSLKRVPQNQQSM